MKKQVVVIHGGNALDQNEDFLHRLKTKAVMIDDFKFKPGWKEKMQSELGKEFEVFNPVMPNKQRAVYEEWKIWFERLQGFLNDELIFVGHSLGGLFLFKYLSENDLNKEIRAIFTVAAPYEGREGKHTRNQNFIHNGNLSNLEKQAQKIFLYHSVDDKIVPYSDFEKYKKLLPNAVFRSFDNYGHFNQEDFPELVEDIKRL